MTTITEFKNEFGNTIDFIFTMENGKKITFNCSTSYYNGLKDIEIYEKDLKIIVSAILDHLLYSIDDLENLLEVRSLVDKIVYNEFYQKGRKFQVWCNEILDGETKELLKPFTTPIPNNFCRKFFSGFSKNL